MKSKHILLVLFVGLFNFHCQSKVKDKIPEKSDIIEEKQIEEAALSTEQLQEYETAYFASGCFWCVEAIFESVKGVKEVISGYAPPSCRAANARQ